MSDINLVITDADLLAYLGIDYDDDMIIKNIERAINTADGELRESVGDDYPVDHPLTYELALIYAANAYESRGDVALTGNEGKRADQLALKLKLYMRRVANGSSI